MIRWKNLSVKAIVIVAVSSSKEINERRRKKW
jgi:hypothetical protein